MNFFGAAFGTPGQNKIRLTAADNESHILQGLDQFRSLRLDLFNIGPEIAHIPDCRRCRRNRHGIDIIRILDLHQAGNQ